MLRLIPRKLHRAALQWAHGLRHRWRRLRGVRLEGVSVVGQDYDGRILLVRHSYGPAGWYFPGGGIRRGEEPLAAARRELREETGCAGEGWSLLGTIEEEVSGAPHHAYVFAAVIDEMPHADRREILEARFFPTHSLPEPLGPRTRARLDLWRQRAE